MWGKKVCRFCLGLVIYRYPDFDLISEFITTCICCIFYYYLSLLFCCSLKLIFIPFVCLVCVLACHSSFCFVLTSLLISCPLLVHWMAGKSSSLRFRVPAMPGWETGIMRDPPVPSTSSPERSASWASDALETNAPPRASYGWTPTPAIPGQKNGDWGGCQVYEKK